MVVSARETIEVSGRNGTAKTTLLKLLGGELKPTEGKVTGIRDCEVSYIDQNAYDFVAPALTIYEHLTLITNNNVDKPSRVGMATQLKSFGLGLEKRLDMFVGELSGGQKQIIAVLATIFSASCLLLLDEFTSALDKHSSSALVEILNKMVMEEKIGVIFFPHQERRQEI